MDPVFRLELKVTPDAVDGNGHVNNVVYVQWMQDAAMRHDEATGGARLAEELGGAWVARTHHVEYLKPALPGDTVVATTWVANFRKVRSLRKYRFLRASDGALLAQAETDWVYVDAATGRPRSVPPGLRARFRVVEGDPPPGG
jgi:acyl-CoA thioester hydrolase